MLGLIDQEAYFALTDAVFARRVDQALELVHQAAARGYDLAVFAEGWVEHLRNLLLVQVMPATAEIAEVAEMHRTRYQQQAAAHTTADLLRAVQVVAETAYQAKRSVQPKFLLEMAAARLVQMESSVTLEELFGRLDALQGLAGAGSNPAAPRPAAGPAVPAAERRVPVAKDPAPPPPPSPLEEEGTQPVVAGPEGQPSATIDNFMEYWPRVISSIKEKKRPLGSVLEEGTIADVNAKELVLRFDHSRRFMAEQVKKDRALIEREIKHITGLPLAVQCQVAPATAGAAAKPRDPQAFDRERIAKADPMTKQIMEMFGGDIVSQ
jgi:DNA polymerase III gamma/tau subunit